LNESQRTIAFVIIVGVSSKSGSVIAGMVAQLITEWWLSCTGQGAQRAPDSSITFNDISDITKHIELEVIYVFQDHQNFFLMLFQ